MFWNGDRALIKKRVENAYPDQEALAYKVLSEAAGFFSRVAPTDVHTEKLSLPKIVIKDYLFLDSKGLYEEGEVFHLKAGVDIRKVVPHEFFHYCQNTLYPKFYSECSYTTLGNLREVGATFFSAAFNHQDSPLDIVRREEIPFLEQNIKKLPRDKDIKSIEEEHREPDGRYVVYNLDDPFGKGPSAIGLRNWVSSIEESADDPYGSYLLIAAVVFAGTGYDMKETIRILLSDHSGAERAVLAVGNDSEKVERLLSLARTE